MEILRGAQKAPTKTILFGLAGVGKSSLAATTSKPLFLDFEGGSNFLDVDRTPVIERTKAGGEWIPATEKLYTYGVELIRAKEREYDTIVIDSADWLMRRMTEDICGIDKDHLKETVVENRNTGGYAKGKQVIENEVTIRLLPMLQKLTEKGYNVVLIAHASRKPRMDGDGFDVDQLMPKIDERTMNLFAEWVDNIFYIKNVDGKRVIITGSGDSNIMAKNRGALEQQYDLDEIDFNALISLDKDNIKKGKE